MALDPGLLPERYTVTRWNADDGLPHGQIHSISQDADGFLWVATWEGTVRFDGHRFRQVDGLNHPDGRRLASRLLWRTEDGSMLVAVDHLGLMRVNGGHAQPACPQFPALEVTHIAPGTDGASWAAARDGMYRLDAGGECVRMQGGEALAERHVLALLEQEDGSLWAGNRLGLYRWHKGRVEPLGEQIGLPPGEVRGLERTADGDVWIAGEHGVWRFRNGRLERVHEGSTEGILQDHRGALWVAGTNSRVLRYWQGKWQQIDQRHGIEGYATGALYEGREGLVWVGTTHGLFRISDGPVWGIGKEQGLINEYARVLLQTDDGQTWVGHSGGLSRVQDSRIESVLPRPGLSRTSVLSLAPASGGGVWAGTYNRGVLHVGADTQTPARLLVEGNNPLATEQVRALLEEPDGTLWIGTERGLRAWRDGEVEEQPLPGLPELPVRTLHRTDTGALWIGFLGGLARREPDGHLVVFRADEDVPVRSAFDFLSDPDGTLWIAGDRGVLRYRDGGFRLYGRQQGLTGSALFSILADDFDNLWVSSNEGVIRIPRRAFDDVDRGATSHLEMQTFSRDDGMPSRQSNGGSSPAGWRMANGELWMPTAAGIAVFDPARVMGAYSGRVSMVIDQVVVDGVSQEGPAPVIEIPPGARLAIHYTGISLRTPNSLRYRYRMHGFDRDWVEADQPGEASYPNLPAGDLRFEVQVAQAPADWSRPANVALVQLHVGAPWWALPSVRLLGLAALLMLLAGVYVWLGRRHRQRQRLLESVVAQRTEELLEKNDQLEEASRQREQLMEQLAHQAHHDSLTGLPNRRACDEHLGAAIKRAQARDRPLCVALLDVDRFKSVNDRYGHQVGDQVLTRLAAQLLESLPSPPVFVGRNGGEEFLIVLSDMGIDEAFAMLEQMRQDIAAVRMVRSTDGLVCTVSVGVVERAAGEGADVLQQRADEALYAAKRQGRDRVVAG